MKRPLKTGNPAMVWDAQSVAAEQGEAVYPVAETTADPVVETTADPIVETTADPIVETTADPIVETTMNPIVETTVNSVVETTGNPVVETTQAPIEEAGQQGFAAATELGDKVRAAIEKTLNETRAHYVTTRSKLDETTAAIETSLGAAREGVTQFNAMAIEAIKADTQTHFDLMTSMFSAKSPSELATLNTEFLRTRFEAAAARAKSFSEFARQIADQSTSPIREQFGKTVKFAS